MQGFGDATHFSFLFLKASRIQCGRMLLFKVNHGYLCVCLIKSCLHIKLKNVKVILLLLVQFCLLHCGQIVVGFISPVTVGGWALTCLHLSFTLLLITITFISLLPTLFHHTLCSFGIGLFLFKQ